MNQAPQQSCKHYIQYITITGNMKLRCTMYKHLVWNIMLREKIIMQKISILIAFVEWKTKLNKSMKKLIKNQTAWTESKQTAVWQTKVVNLIYCFCIYDVFNTYQYIPALTEKPDDMVKTLVILWLWPLIQVQRYLQWCHLDAPWRIWDDSWYWLTPASNQAAIFCHGGLSGKCGRLNSYVHTV